MEQFNSFPLPSVLSQSESTIKKQIPKEPKEKDEISGKRRTLEEEVNMGREHRKNKMRGRWNKIEQDRFVEGNKEISNRSKVVWEELEACREVCWNTQWNPST